MTVVASAVESRATVNQKRLEKLLGKLDKVAFVPSDMPLVVFHDIVDYEYEDYVKEVGHNTYEHQRDIKDKRLLELAEKMRDGRFTTAVIAVAEYNGENILVNGQNTMYAGIATRQPQRLTRMVFRCETVEQLACLWAQWDTGGTRTPRQMAAVYAPTLGEGWTAKNTSLLATACLLYTKDGRATSFGSLYQTTTMEDRIRLIGEYLPEATFARNVIYGQDGDDERLFLSRSHTAAIIMRTFHRSPKDAENFWMGVRNGFNIDSETNPVWLLRTHLEKLPRSGSSKEKGRHKETSLNIDAKCINAWNAFRQHRPLTILKGRTIGAPMPKID